MPSKLTSVSAFLCEKILMEADGVLSAIRLVELFNFTPASDVPLEKQGPTMVLYVNGKLPPGDNDEHIVELFLLRPNGETTALEGPPRTKMASTFAGFPGGFAIGLQLTVPATQMGLHHFIVKFDGEEVRRLPFMLSQLASTSVR